MFISEFSTCYTTSETFKQRDTQGLTSKMKTVKVHGSVCDVYTAVIKRYMSTVNQSILKHPLCSIVLMSIPYTYSFPVLQSEKKNIQANFTLKFTC